MTSFFVGLHIPNHAWRFERCMVSVNVLRGRARGKEHRFRPNEWMMDSGAFTEVTKYGGYRYGVEEHAAQIMRWSRCGNMVAAAAQDYMCEPFVLKITGLTVEEHQRLTVERYDGLLHALIPFASRAAVDENALQIPCILPVLQGYHPSDYVRHLAMYDYRLEQGAWVGVGSVCKRNSHPSSVEDVLLAIHDARPDLRLHGFGIKLTALQSGIVSKLLYSADSMAWSFAARRDGRNANCPHEAAAYVERVERRRIGEAVRQRDLFAA